MKTRTNEFKTKIKDFGRELDSIITYTIDGTTTELGNEQLNSAMPHYEGAILKSVMKQLDIDSNVEIPVGTKVNYTLGIKTRYEEVEDYRDNYDYIDYGNYIVYSTEKQEDTRSWKIVCYDKMLYAMKDYENSNITFPITIKDYLEAICEKVGLEYEGSQFANSDKVIDNELYLDNEGRPLGYTFRDVLDEIAQVSGGTICINKDDKLEVRYINNTDEIIDEEYLKDINVNFGEKFGAVNTIVLSRGGDGDKIGLSIPSDLADEDKVAIQITDNQIMNGNNRDEFMPAILNKLYGLEYYINDFSSTGICYLDLCDSYRIKIGDNTYKCIMFNDEVNITQGLEELIYTDMQEENEQDYKYISSTDRGITQANIIANKAEATITSFTQQLDATNNRLNSVEVKQTATDETINIISTNIDANGNITEVTTTTGFTFNAEGMTIADSSTNFSALHRNNGTYYYDGSTIVGQYTKDGSKQKDLELFGVYYYGKNSLNEDPMFVAQLYTDEYGNEGFGHFYNRGD